MFFTSFIERYLHTLSNLDYIGLAVVMAIEGTCLPVLIPMEAVIIPMGYLAFLGQKSMLWLIISSTIGTVIGCLVNYYSALALGRPIIYKYAKYFMLNITYLEKLEKLFLKNSRLILFLGRCAPIPAIKHIVTIPAGISKMNIKDFIIYNTVGAACYLTAILYIGYFTGGNEALAKNIIKILAILIIGGVPCIYFGIKFSLKLYNKQKNK